MLQSRDEYRSSAHKISIYNSLGGELSTFDPIDTSTTNTKVKMYVCGLTPQDHSHLGHGLLGMRFDIVRRYLAYRRLNVDYVQNVTDIDDKIIDKVLKTGQDPMKMTRALTDEFYECLTRLHALPVERITRVTEFVPEIIRFIEQLIAKEFAYVTPDGGVYFDVSKKADYGKLSNQNTAMLFESVRKELDSQKRSPVDFALWKRDESSALSQPSPWGIGRPGWHIECSAMIHEVLGDRIDIHGGGLDIKFPHHENEIAQSEAYSGCGFATFWMHSGLLNIDGQKMSKSLNNSARLVDGIERYGAAPLRFVVARHHYRSAIDLNDKLFRDNLNSLLEFHRLFARIPEIEQASSDNTDVESSAVIEAFETAMNNDFNSPEALVALEQFRALVLRKLEVAKEPTAEIANKARLLRELGEILGLFFDPLEVIETQGLNLIAQVLNAKPLTIDEIHACIAERSEARAAKNFLRSDQIRDEMALRGVELLDSKNSVTFRFA